MKPTQIYLIRHGQSEGNLHHRFLGHTDLDLTPLGYEQAQKAAEHLDSVPADCIYSSDLMRAYHTALATAQRKGLPIIKTSALREIYAGDWENQESDLLREKYPQSYKAWVEDTGNSRPDGGESVAELAFRFAGEVEKLAKENEGKTILIFAHGTPIRAMKTLWSSLPLEDIRQIPWPSNASITHAVYENGTFSVLEYSVNSFLENLSSRLPDEA